MIPMAIVFSVCELMYFRGTPVEHTRKASHVIGGVVVFFMPYVVSSHWTVLGIALAFAVVLAASKAMGLLQSVHSVERRTRGAEFYPIAVYLIFLLADGNALLFQVPILVMALSDTGAAVVGQRYGIVHYRVIEGVRSLGGSVTFFGLTFSLVLVGLGIAGHGDLPSALIISLLVALVATAVEGISVRGADNLLVPYATFVVLRATIYLDRDSLGLWILGAALVLATLMATFRQARLNTSGFMAAFLLGVLAWGIGGPVWLATLAVPYVGFCASRPVASARRKADLRIIVPALATSLLLILVYGHLAEALIFVPFLASVAALSAIALTGFCEARWPQSTLAQLSGFVGVLAALIPALFMETPVLLTPAAFIVVCGGSMAGPVLTRRCELAEMSQPMARIAGVFGGTLCALTWMAGQALG